MDARRFGTREEAKGQGGRMDVSGAEGRRTRDERRVDESFFQQGRRYASNDMECIKNQKNKKLNNNNNKKKAKRWNEVDECKVENIRREKGEEKGRKKSC